MTKLIFIICAFLLHGSAGSQDAQLTYEVVNPGPLGAGDTMRVKLKLILQPGWYIYAPTAINKTQDVQVMKLKFIPQPALLRQCSELIMPVPQLNKNHEVFAGADNWFYQDFVVGQDVGPGNHTLTAQLKYQACSNSICFPPVTQKIEIPFTITTAGLPATEIVNRTISRAKKENKKAFIMFHSSWCVWCRKMDAAMQDPACKNLFRDNYVVEHLTVYESEKNKERENPGADELLKKHQPPNSGIPFWLIFDGDGKLVADSQVRPSGASLQTHGKNMGCPTAPEEVAHFITILRNTSSMTETDLATIARVFSALK